LLKEVPSKKLVVADASRTIANADKTILLNDFFSETFTDPLNWLSSAGILFFGAPGS
jgi:hypothetical protein